MKNLIALHGSDHKVGTTMISQSIAELISKNRKDIKLLWVVFGTGDGKDYANHVSESVEGFRLQLNSRILTCAEVMRACKQSENLFMLGGISSFLEKRNYFPETASFFLECVGDAFDLIIADCGNEVDNGLALGALENCSVLYFILSQRESAIRGFEKQLAIYKRLGIEGAAMVVNHFQEEDPFTLEYIEKRLTVSHHSLFKVQDAGYGRQAEVDRKTLLFYGERPYMQDIWLIADSILKQCGLGCLNRDEDKRRKRWIHFI